MVRRVTEIFVCAQCGRPLVEKGPENRVVCSADEEHEGWVSATTVEIRRAQRRYQKHDLEHLYPELFPKEEPKGTLDDLF